MKNNFYNSRHEYEENAFVQKEMAEHLFSKLGSAYRRILEVGCGMGTFTRHLYKNCTFLDYYAIDLIAEYQTIFQFKYPQVNFIAYDMDKLESFFPSSYFNLIVSNAAIQWSHNPKRLIHTCMNRLAPNGILALAFFGENNYKQIRDIFSVGLDYFSRIELNEIMNEYDVLYFHEEERNLQFETTIDVFRHIKKTGVGGLMQSYLSKEQCRQYNDRYQNVLTYHPMYLILKNH